MKRALLGLLALTLLAAGPASDTPTTQEAAPPPSMDRTLSNTRGYAAKVIASCSPTGKDLITRDQSVQRSWSFTRYDNAGLLRNWSVDVGPPVDPMAYIRGTRPIDVLLEIPTAIHEIGRGHAYRSAFGAAQSANVKVQEGQEFRNYYLGSDRSVLVQVGAAPPASQAAGSVPEALRLPRYNILSNPPEGASTEKRGAYGLLDELVGYNLRARVAMDVLLCGWEDSNLTPTMWLDLITAVDSALLAREEMSVYLLSYLNVVKQSSPDAYAAFLANKPFVTTALEADKRLGVVQGEFEPALAALFKRLDERGVSADVKKDKYGIGGTWRKRFSAQQTAAREALGAAPLAAIRGELVAAGQ